MRNSHGLLFFLLLGVLGGCAADQGGGDTSFSARSGLHWQRCAYGAEWDGVGCAGEATELNWDEAIDACATMGPGYRLPTLGEVGLLLGECSGPAAAARCAPCEASDECFSTLADERFDMTWTADPAAADEGAFIVDLGTGVIAYEDMTRPLQVRCVTDAL